MDELLLAEGRLRRLTSPADLDQVRAGAERLERVRRDPADLLPLLLAPVRDQARGALQAEDPPPRRPVDA